MKDEHRREYLSKLERRVGQAASAALAEQKFVSPIDVLTGLGWLPWSAVDRWRQGRVDYLERAVNSNASKISAALEFFRRWAHDQDLQPSETAYLARTRERRQLRFSESGDPDVERAYRTHWVSKELSETQQRRLAERQSRPPDLVVISARNEWTCATCSERSYQGLLLMADDAPRCLRCVGLDHLVFLGSGDAKLTRRAKKLSELSAVVVRFSPARRRYERQGLLVEEAALDQAERECQVEQTPLRRGR
jgi:hypothetical protein